MTVTKRMTVTFFPSLSTVSTLGLRALQPAAHRRRRPKYATASLSWFSPACRVSIFRPQLNPPPSRSLKVEEAEESPSLPKRFLDQNRERRKSAGRTERRSLVSLALPSDSPAEGLFMCLACLHMSAHKSVLPRSLNLLTPCRRTALHQRVHDELPARERLEKLLRECMRVRGKTSCVLAGKGFERSCSSSLLPLSLRVPQYATEHVVQTDKAAEKFKGLETHGKSWRCTAHGLWAILTSRLTNDQYLSSMPQ
jgi:hypothetical protein